MDHIIVDVVLNYWYQAIIVSIGAEFAKVDDEVLKCKSNQAEFVHNKKLNRTDWNKPNLNEKLNKKIQNKVKWQSLWSSFGILH